MSRVSSSTLRAKGEECPPRITRSRARVLESCSKNEGKNVKRAVSSNRCVSSENKTCVVVPDLPPRKRRAGLTDVTNIGAKPRDKRVKQSQFQVKVLTLSSNACFRLYQYHMIDSRS